MQVSVSGAAATGLLAALLLAPAGQAAAQIEHDYTQVKYDRGLNVQPAFEGWVRNPDGTIDLWFGYLNRNWAQRLHIPIGPDNVLDPGGPDHGQPTFFYARRHRYAFKVTVPEAWDDEYTWTLTVNGRTDTIHASLFPEDELLEHNVLAARGQGFGIAPRNQPPSIAIDATERTTDAAGTVTLTARVSDDGLPRPRTDRRRTRSTRPDVPERVIDPDPGAPPRAPGCGVDPVAGAGTRDLRGRGGDVAGGRGGPARRTLLRTGEPVRHPAPRRRVPGSRWNGDGNGALQRAGHLRTQGHGSGRWTDLARTVDRHGHGNRVATGRRGRRACRPDP